MAEGLGSGQPPSPPSSAPSHLPWGLMQATQHPTTYYSPIIQLKTCRPNLLSLASLWQAGHMPAECRKHLSCVCVTSARKPP